MDIDLTLDQKSALDLIKHSNSETVLLYGVTGSGKTEVYLQAVADVLRRGKRAMVLAPEIGLTSQLVQRFKDRFQDHIALMHSGLTIKQRREEWERIATGQARIVLGTRLAVFAPISNLGLIVLDEEYEVTYKAEKSPRYHTRSVAEYLAKQNNAVLVLGSATPSIETFYKAKTGEYKLAVLPKRIDDKPLPPVEVVDMRKELKAKHFGMLSRKLRQQIKETISKGQQVLLFINRVGFFTFVMCRECGLTIKCPKCSVPLSYDPKSKVLTCNHCDFKRKSPPVCPNCNSSNIKFFGSGTQRIETELGNVIPEAKIIRLDRQVTKKRGTQDVILKTFAEGKADVLIGTQMITKGMDLANITLVGVVAADTSLNLPDFRAAEHTFQQLTQVAGRAGRHHLPGKVIIQTYNPDNYAVKYAAKHDYEGFYEEEIETRKELDYPPFAKLINITFQGKDEQKVSEVCEDFVKLFKTSDEVQALGPAPAPISKVRGDFRWQVLLKGQKLETLHKNLQDVLSNMEIPREVRLLIDVEPVNML